jgi:hypothetical protein
LKRYEQNIRKPQNMTEHPRDSTTPPYTHTHTHTHTLEERREGRKEGKLLEPLRK